MAKIDPTRRELDKLRALDLSDLEGTQKALTLALGSSSPAVVKRAATIAVQAVMPQLAPQLIVAYRRLVKGDPGCETKTAIVRALIELEVHEEDFYLSQRLYRQPEWVFGAQTETAGELRGLCGMGLARCRYRYLLEVLVDLMVDSDLNTRMLAVRAVGDSGQTAAAVPLLRLKALTERTPEVVGECLVSLLLLAPEATCDWISERFLPDGPFEAVVLALGESRHRAALDLLIKLYRSDLVKDDKQTLLLAIATCRQKEGVEFLIRLLDDEPELARRALELYRSDPAVWSRVEG